MKIEQVYTGCLAKAAYYVESNGEAVIIDPLRETQPYIEKAQAENASIKYVLETHFNPNFVSGHLDLAEKTGATLVFGPNAKLDFEAYIAKDNEELKVGKITILVLHTPGHSMESTCYLLKDESGKDRAIFTGNTLITGDVGLSFFASQDNEVTYEDLAGFLFDSLRNKIMPLENEVIVYPGHGTGSACGKKMRIKAKGTLGDQKQINEALWPDMTKAEFVKKITSGLSYPTLHSLDITFGHKKDDGIEKVKEKTIKPLKLRAFKAAWELEEALVLDTRSKEQFARGFIPGSIFIGLDGNFDTMVRTLISDPNRRILFVAEPGREEEVITHLVNLGFNNLIGYLKGGFETWQNADEQIDLVEEVYPIVFTELYKRKNLNVLDVRKKSELNTDPYEGVEKFPLKGINRNMNLVNRNEKHYLCCGNGYRSLVAASILKARGIHDVVNVKGGYNRFSSLNPKRIPDKKLVTGF